MILEIYLIGIILGIILLVVGIFYSENLFVYFGALILFAFGFLILIYGFPSLQSGGGRYLFTNNVTIIGNATAGTNTWEGNYTNFISGNLNMNANALIDVGLLVMSGMITSKNITVDTDGLYSIGNETHWFKNLYSQKVYAQDINTTDLTSSRINSKNVTSEDTSSDRMNTSNMTIGGYEIIENNGDLTIILK